MKEHRDKKAKKKNISTTNKGVTATGFEITESLSSANQLKSQATSPVDISDDLHNVTEEKNSDKLENIQDKKNVKITIDNPDNLQNVRDDLRNVIELMGPSTPHLNLNTSSEAEIDDSYISTSYYSSVVQVKHVSKADDSTSTYTKTEQYDKVDFISDTPRDMSQISALPSDSMYTEQDDQFNLQVGGNKNVELDRAPLTQELEEIDHFNACLDHYKTCPCRQYIKNLQQMATNRGRSIFRKEYTILQDEPNETRFRKVINLLSYFKFKRPSREYARETTMDLYKVNILQGDKEGEGSPPRRLVFDKIDDIPKPETSTVATNTNKEKPPERVNVGVGVQMTGVPGVPTPFHTFIPPSRYQPHRQYYHERSGSKAAQTKETQTKKNCTKVDIYYFDHGSASYFKTTDCPPCLVTELIAEKTEAYTSRFWAEFFGTVHIGFAFFTSFILQLLRFILQSLIRPLLIGLIQLTSDYFFKPFLTVVFNAIVQPPLVFLYNIFTSIRDLMDPIAESLGYFLNEIANVFRAIRLVDVRNGIYESRSESCRKKRCKRRHSSFGRNCAC